MADVSELGWSVCTDFLPSETIRTLATECGEERHHGGFRPAKVGIGSSLQLRPEIRSDHVHWLDETRLTSAQQTYFDAIEALRHKANQALYLGLFEFEAHLTVYPAGAGYQRHFDRFPGSEYRLLSCILYLNSDWQPDHGGQLRLYPNGPNAAHVDVLPKAGTLACFLSEGMEHQVLESNRERLSVTGWLCSRR